LRGSDIASEVSPSSACTSAPVFRLGVRRGSGCFIERFHPADGRRAFDAFILSEDGGMQNGRGMRPSWRSSDLGEILLDATAFN
jgi:hypothetical protein